MPQQILVIIALIAALALVVHAEQNAPDPYEQCAQRATEIEQAQCRNLIDFALSAGM